MNDTQSMGGGSENLIVTGTGANQVFKGVTQRTASPSNPIGTKLLMNVGDQYGGLGNFADTALGSIFRVLGAIFFIGSGRLYYNGADTGATASSTLSLKRLINGVLGTTFQAGLAQPSAPIITAISPPPGLIGKNDGTVSVKTARVRSATGARSIASLTSNVAVCKNQSVLVEFPSADLNGQDYWEVDVTLNGYGGVGNHYFLQEIPETALIGSVPNITATAVSSTTISVPNDTLTTSNVGWSIQGTAQWEYIVCATTGVTAGNAKTVVTAAGMTGSPKTITFALAGGETAAQIATALYNALDGDADVTAVFDVYKDDETVYLKKITGTDPTVNFTLEDDTTTGIVDVLNSITGTIATWVTAVGASDSASTGNQLITLNGTIGVAPTETDTVTFTRGVNGVPRSYAFEWRDADLAGADLAPIYDYPPPAGLFGGVLGDVTFVDGALGDTVNTATNTANANPITYPGNVIAVSEPARPESFPFSNYIFTNDNPVALVEGSQGLYWRFGRNSLGVIRYIGGSPALSYERIWTGAGIVNQRNVVLGGGGRLYAYTGARGAVRMGMQGEIDTSFSARIADDTAGWIPANVVLGYDANYQYVFYAHDQVILAYYEPMDLWCAPLNLAATLGTKNILAMVTYNAEVYIAAGDSDGISLYSFNTGTGTAAKLMTQWQQSGGEFDILSRVKLALRSDISTTATLNGYVNGEATPVNTQVFDINAGLSVPTTLRPNIRNARIWRLETRITSGGGDTGVETIAVDGDTSGITT
jgi:hypothetical protein